MNKIYYKIEDNIPRVIVTRNKRKSQLRKVLEKMAVTQSTLVPKAKAKAGTLLMAKLQKANGHKYSMRTQANGDIRIWRIN